MNNLEKIRLDFPILSQKIQNNPFIYFDSAATALMPQEVLDGIVAYYGSYKANVDRGLYDYAEKTTKMYEHTRSLVAHFIHALPEEIIFTSGTTDGINKIARMWAIHNLCAGDEIIVSSIEHHANFLPWQQLAQEKSLILTIIPVDQDGFLDMKFFYAALSEKTKLVAIVHTSNILGTTFDIESIVLAAHQVGAKVLLDAAQSIAHQKLNVQQMGIDFLVFSGHKLYGPTGVGCLFIKKTLHNECFPSVFGGSMVYSAGYEESFWKNAPYCFEAGTPPIAQVIGLGHAIEYVQKNINFDELAIHEKTLVAQAVIGLQNLGFTIVSSQYSSHVVTFYDQQIHAHDIAMYLNSYGIAVRAGNHCVQPYHEKIGVDATVRLSFSVYNTVQEVAYFLQVMAEL